MNEFLFLALTSVDRLQVLWTLTDGIGSAVFDSSSATINDPGFQAPAKWNLNTEKSMEYAGANLFGSVPITDPYIFVEGLKVVCVKAGSFQLTAVVSADSSIGSDIPAGTELLSVEYRTLIPEPSTMALLGLGAFLLHRKKTIYK